MSAERATTPENASITDLQSSPVKSSRNVAGHDRDEVARKVLPRRTTIVTVSEFLELLTGEQKTVEGELEDGLQSGEDLIKYLNKLSEAFREEQATEDRIVFRLSENESPGEHPTGAKCRPDFVAVKTGPKANAPSSVTAEQAIIDNPQPKQDRGLIWSQLETTGEIYSKGSTDDAAIAQGGSYTGCLLQARPDLISVVGMFAKFHCKQPHFRLYFTDAWGICQTEAVDFNSTDTTRLLTAYVRRLYNPEGHLNIKRAGHFPSKPTFTIDVEGHGQFTGCVLLRVGSPFHRRSIIFAVPQSSSSRTQLIIKSQYVEKGRRFEEGPILRRIHEFYDFPGIARLMPATGVKQGPETVEAESEAVASSSGGFVTNAAGEGAVAQVRDKCLEADATKQKSVAEGEVSGVREGKTAPDINNATPATGMDVEWSQNRRDKETRETLLVLQDKAGLLMDANTPLEALMAFYDLFEVIRILYEHRKILHRDISAGNVLLREQNWAPEKPFEEQFVGMCFASHLLGEKGPNPGASRLHTRVLLIDFDMAEDRGNQSGQPSPERSGTPMFMARLVRNPVVRKGVYLHPAMPQLQGFALERYKACVNNRIDGFPKNEKSIYEIEDKKEIRYSHRLSYDAESIVWLLFSWAIQAKPMKRGSENWIPEQTWAVLTCGEGAKDPRQGLAFQGDFCHPVYRGLDRLLNSLFEQLWGYQEQVARPPDKQDPGRMKDAYLHEAFQRIILDFIVEMIEQPFMQEPISRIRRRREHGGAMSQSATTPSTSTKRNHETVAGTGIQKSGQPGKKRPKASTAFTEDSPHLD